jgi:hypothetical protein
MDNVITLTEDGELIAYIDEKLYVANPSGIMKEIEGEKYVCFPLQEVNLEDEKEIK